MDASPLVASIMPVKVEIVVVLPVKKANDRKYGIKLMTMTRKIILKLAQYSENWP